MGIWKSIKEYYKTSVKGTWHILLVLMWKHLTEHQNCWCSMLWRIIQGCSVFITLFIVTHAVYIEVDIDASNSKQLIRKAHTHNKNDSKIFFSPRNNITNKLMDSVINKLNQMDLANQPDLRSVGSWEFGFYNSRRLMNDTRNMNILVDFKDLGLKNNNLSYSITVFTKPVSPKHKNHFKDILYELLSAEITNSILGSLQWAIDKSYLEHLENHTVLQDLRFEQRANKITPALTIIQNFLHWCTVISSLPFFLHKSSRLSRAKRIGFQNILRVSGVSSNMLRVSHLMDTALAGSIYAVFITIILKMTAKPIVPYSNSVIIMVSIVLYFLNIVAMAFVTSTVSSDYNHADSMAILVYLYSFFLGFKWFTQEKTSEITRVVVCCLLPHAPMYLFWDKVIELERVGEGVNFSNINLMHDFHLPTTVLWLIFLMQLVLLIIVDWYLEQVIPARFGVTRRWNFIFERKILKKKKKMVNFHVTAEQNVHVLRDSRYYEEDPEDVAIMVKINNVTKHFHSLKKVVALDKIYLNVFRGEVTVILGPMDAGKSTLLGIIAGIQSASSGSVYVKGLDNVRRSREVQDIVAFCPQENMLFRYLTVRENIMFYEKLRNQLNFKSTVDEILSVLQMTEHANFLTDELPKGLRRCLQVACTIVSGADVLVLDEPTSDMGIAATHRIWDVIMKLRGRKTIIMTTKVLEEASALGDRIAILNKGKMQCHGSPSFLHDAIGIGLNLTITLKNKDYLEALQFLVEKAIPDVKCQTRGARCMSFMLPQKERAQFLTLIDTLESKRQEYSLTSIDIGVFMEAVYLQFIDQYNEEDVVMETEFDSTDMKRSRDWKVVRTQFIILIQRVYHYVWLKKYQFILMQILLPMTGIFLVSLTTNHDIGYGKFIRSSWGVTRMVVDMEPYRRAAKMEGRHIDKGSEMPHELSISKHTSQLSENVNRYSNMYLKSNLPKLNKRISTSFRALNSTANITQVKSVFHSLSWVVWIMFLSVLPLTPFIMLAITEQNKGTRNIFNMAGCSTTVQWCSKLVAHFSIYMIIIPPTVVFAAKYLDFDETFQQFQFLCAVFLLLLFFALAFLAHLDFLSFFLHDYIAMGQIYFMALGMGVIVPIVMYSIIFLEETFKNLDIMYQIFYIVAILSPLCLFSMCLLDVVYSARNNAFCNLNRHLCPDFEHIYFGVSCCRSKTDVPYEYFNEQYLKAIFILIVLMILYLSIAILFQNRVIQNCLGYIKYYRFKKRRNRFLNKDVQREKERVEDRVLIKEFSNEILIVSKICKAYNHRENSLDSGNVVGGVSFMVKKGECFGILGPSGCGKTTLLQMLAGCITLTRGNCWVAGHNLRKERSKYLRKITSSTGKLDSFYTGYENLVLIGRLAGYSKSTAEKMTLIILRDLGLLPYSNILVQNYTTCVKKRLLLCVIYILNPAVALIDEPMLHVDHTNRHLVARALENLLAGGTTLVLAQTSLDWYQMQSIYDRIAVLYDGQFAALGSAEDVIRDLTTGYSVHIKLKVFKAYWTSKMALKKEFTVDHNYLTIVEKLKRDFKSEFENCVLAEEHVCMLFFYIKDHDRTLSYIEIFTKLHVFIENHQHIVESYTFNKTTVEEVFWRIPYLIDQL